MAVVAACAGPGRQPAGRPSTSVAAAYGPVLSIRLGGEVDGLAAGGGYVWAYVRDSGLLVRVDQRTGQLRSFPLSRWRGMPVVIAAGARGLWLANQHSSRPDLTRISLWSGRVIARPRLPGDSGPISAVMAAYRSVWIVVPDGGRTPGWRVLRLDPASNRIDGISARIPGAQLTGSTAAIWASAGRIWVTGSTHSIASLDPRTLAVHTATTPGRSQDLFFGAGHAWSLDHTRPSLAVINPRTGKLLRTLAVPPPSATGDDAVTAGPGLLWVFRGSLLTRLNPATGDAITRTRLDPLAPAFYSPAVIAGRSLWYLAQTSHGTALDRITANR
jgi:hypothetical protein